MKSFLLHTPTKRQEPSKEHKLLRNELKQKIADNLVEKLGKNDRLKSKPISLELD